MHVEMTPEWDKVLPQSFAGIAAGITAVLGTILFLVL